MSMIKSLNFLKIVFVTIICSLTNWQRVISTKCIELFLKYYFSSQNITSKNNSLVLYSVIINIYYTL